MDNSFESFFYLMNRTAVGLYKALLCVQRKSSNYYLKILCKVSWVPKVFFAYDVKIRSFREDSVALHGFFVSLHCKTRSRKIELRLQHNT